jgi:(2Fe-2S) ferredoxin
MTADLEAPLKAILICRHTTCRKQGAAQVRAAFRNAVSEGTGSITVIESGCLGHCGSGPMVLLLPEQIWYAGVTPQGVPDILQAYLGARKSPLPADDRLVEAPASTPRRLPLGSHLGRLLGELGLLLGLSLLILYAIYGA